MAQGEEADVERDVLQPIEKKNDAEEEQQMVVSRGHVLGPEIDERKYVNARYLLNVTLVAFCHGVRHDIAGGQQQQEEEDGDPQAGRRHGCSLIQKI